MLPKKIIKDLAFYTDLTEQQAKDKLKSSETEENLLFINGKEQDDIILCYKAFFRGEMQVRTMKFTYVKDGDHFYNSALGNNLISLNFIAKCLTPFLQGFADGKFNPIPLNKIVTTQHTSTPLLEPLLNEIVTGVILPKLDSKTLSSLSLTSKAFNYHAQKLISGTIDQERLKAAQEQGKKISLAYYNIKTKLVPDAEGKPNPSKYIYKGNFKISEPQEYGTYKITCKVTNGTTESFIIISDHSIDLMNKEFKADNEFYDTLVEATEFGTLSPYLKYQAELSGENHSDSD